VSRSLADFDLEQLSEEARQTLHDFGPLIVRDASPAEISSELGLERKVVKQRLARLEEELRAQEAR
jgi:DNA-directed RNA polymerase specialized sigma24 family protein